jgi:hypothetical protein
MPISAAAGKAQKPWLQATEKRLAVTSKMLGIMKLLKMSGLGQVLELIVANLRTKEIRSSNRYRILTVLVDTTCTYLAYLTVHEAGSLILNSLCLSCLGTRPRMDSVCLYWKGECYSCLGVRRGVLSFEFVPIAVQSHDCFTLQLRRCSNGHGLVPPHPGILDVQRANRPHDHTGERQPERKLPLRLRIPSRYDPS